MSIYKSSSLAMIPTAYKDGKLYSIRPTDGSGDFTFSRGSNLAATRVDVNGLIEKGRENLVLQSNQFDDSGNWGLQNATLTSGQSGYDGSLNAWLFSHSSTTAYLYQQKTLSVSVNTASIYVKKGTSSTIRLEFVTASFGKGAACSFDLENGTAGSVTHYGSSSGFLATINAVSNGWYRISLTGVTAADAWYHELALTSGNIYIQDTQLEQGLVATDYIETGASTAQAGILEDMPRLDYSGGASCPSLLLEPQRTNIITNSEYLGASSWVKSGNGTGSTPVITSNAAISPEGIQNATRVDLDLNGGTSSGDWSWVYQNFTSTGNDETFSMYVKAVDASNVGKVIAFGAVSFTAQSLTADWVRIEGTSSAAVGGYGNGFRLRGTEATSDTASFYVYGIQHEQNSSYPTSYIPTYGTSQTRSFDSCLATSVSDLIGQTQGTMLVDFVFNGNPTSVDYSIMILGAIGSNYITIGGYNKSLYARVFNSTSQGTINALQMVAGTRYKVAVAYAENDVVMYVNGVNEGSDTSVSIPALSQVGFTRPSFEHSADVKQSLVFPTRLTNAELAALTTL